MKKRLIALTTVIAFALVIAPAFAIATIRVEPHGSYFGLPVMLSSPATFMVNLTEGKSGNPTTDPHIFLVMTEDSFEGLTGDVVVNWTHEGSPVSITITSWTKETDNSVKLPPGTANGDEYTVASLRDHLQTSEPIYWAFEAFLSGEEITETPIAFTVTLPSTHAEMAVYVLGKTVGSELFDNRSPPTQPGFVVPEPAVIVAMGMSFTALAGYAVVKRKR